MGTVDQREGRGREKERKRSGYQENRILILERVNLGEAASAFRGEIAGRICIELYHPASETLATT